MKPFAILPLLACLAASLPSAGAPAADLYKAKCAMCHGADGSGNTPMGKKLEIHDLRAETTRSQSDAQLAEILENGKGKMPGQKGRLSKDEIKQLVAHVREFAKKR